MLAWEAGPVAETGQEVWSVVTLLIYLLTGLGMSMVFALIALLAGKLLARRRVAVRMLGRRIFKSGLVSFALFGLLVGWETFVQTRVTPLWLDYFAHALVICWIAALTWLATRSLYVFEDLAFHHLEQAQDDDGSEAAKRTRSRMLTQAQILRRVVQAVVVAAGIVAIALTFPQARVAMSSLLASAGIASVVATLAAQNALANVFAGMQIALTDAIRVGDTVVLPSVDGRREQGRIEEITLTYVVVMLVDERRLVVPSTHFTQQKFENWSRKETEQLGGVELRLDFSAPVEEIRVHALAWLQGHPLWDGRVGRVGVTDSTETSMTVRVLVSAADAGQLWNLRCELREEMYGWLARHYPLSFVRQRYYTVEDPQPVAEDAASGTV